MTTIILILVILWAMGYVGGYALGGLLHLLLLIALILFIVDLIQRRSPPL